MAYTFDKGEVSQMVFLFFFAMHIDQQHQDLHQVDTCMTVQLYSMKTVLTLFNLSTETRSSRTHTRLIDPPKLHILYKMIFLSNLV